MRIIAEKATASSFVSPMFRNKIINNASLVPIPEKEIGMLVTIEDNDEKIITWKNEISICIF